MFDMGRTQEGEENVKGSRLILTSPTPPYSTHTHRFREQ